jgi:hypothetical protein
MMLRELEAFEACWLDLKDVYPTSGQDNILLTQAMGQLVDLTAKPAQVEQDLPDHLRILFRRLALAYFQGYFPSRRQAPVAQVAAAPPNPQCDLQQRHEISAAVDQIKALAQRTQTRIQKNRGQAPQVPLSEMETLIIEFPEYWQPA